MTLTTFASYDSPSFFLLLRVLVTHLLSILLIGFFIYFLFYFFTLICSWIISANSQYTITVSACIEYLRDIHPLEKLLLIYRPTHLEYGPLLPLISYLSKSISLSFLCLSFHFWTGKESWKSVILYNNLLL